MQAPAAPALSRDGVDVGGEIPNPISRMANVETIEAHFPDPLHVPPKVARNLADPASIAAVAGGEMAIVAHDAPDGGINYVFSGKGTKFPQSEGLAGGYPGAVNDYVGFVLRRECTTTVCAEPRHGWREGNDVLGRISVNGQ